MAFSLRATVITSTSVATCQIVASKKKYYAVVAGYKPGIYETWKECERQVKGFKGQVYKAFKSKVEAEDFLATTTSRLFPTAIANQGLQMSRTGKLFKNSLINSLKDNATSSAFKVAPANHKVLRLETGTKELELDKLMQPAPKQPPTYLNAALNSISDVDVLYQLEYDGASKGNPGHAGAGALLRHPDGTVICEVSAGLGRTTNNVAEYKGLISGMRKALDLGVERIQAQGDSKLVTMQIQGKWKIRNENLALLHGEAMDLLNNFKEFKIRHVDREFNATADALANKGVVLPEGNFNR